MNYIAYYLKYFTLPYQFPFYTFFNVLYWICLSLFLISFVALIYVAFSFMTEFKKHSQEEKKEIYKMYSVHNIQDLLSTEYYRDLVHSNIILSINSSQDSITLKAKYGTYLIERNLDSSQENSYDGELINMRASSNINPENQTFDQTYFFFKEYSLIEKNILETNAASNFSKEDLDLKEFYMIALKLFARTLFGTIILFLLTHGLGAAVYDYYFSNGVSTHSLTGVYEDFGFGFRNYFDEIVWTKDTSTLPVTVYFQGKRSTLKDGEEKDSYYIFKFISLDDERSYLSEIYVDNLNMTLFKNTIFDEIFEHYKMQSNPQEPTTTQPDSPLDSEISSGDHQSISNIFPPGIYSDISGLNAVYLEHITDTSANIMLMTARPHSEEISFTSTFNIELNNLTSKFKFDGKYCGYGTGKIEFDPVYKCIYINTQPEFNPDKGMWPLKFDNEKLIYTGPLPDDYHSGYFDNYYENSPHYN